MSDLQLSNVINVSISAAQTGIGAYNTSNLALFSDEPYQASFGNDGYKIYLDAVEVGKDFGTSSNTYTMATKIFSQQPNILAGGGYLVVIPFIEAKQTLAFDAVAASGSFVMTFTEGSTAAINWDDTAAAIQTKIRAVTGLENVVVTGSIAGESLVIDFQGKYGPQTLITIGSNTLADAGSSAVSVTPSSTQTGETINDAIVRTEDVIQYFGLMGTLIFDQSDMLAAAATIQTLNKIAFFCSRTSADVEPNGMLDMLRQNNYHQSRGLFYGGAADIDALSMMATYAGRALSTNFSGSNTTQIMHLKDLIGVTADPSMTQTLLNKCITAGVDTYVSLQGVAKVFTSGENQFFDQVYNEQWFVGAIQVAGFNYLAESSTKIPQTESGMDGLKGAYRQVCEQAVSNQYCAPGSWNSPTTFGNQKDFLDNITQRGYYIYSQPIALQSQVDRAARKAPLAQIALKEAGGIQSSSVVVYINA